MMNAFWASENFDAFMANCSSQPRIIQPIFPVMNDGVFGEQVRS
jgi:hypothetical protein